MRNTKPGYPVAIIAALLILLSSFSQNFQAGPWYAYLILYLVVSLELQERFLLRFVIEGKKSFSVQDARFLNVAILALSTISTLIFFSLSLTFFIGKKFGSLEEKIQLTRTFQGLFSFSGLGGIFPDDKVHQVTVSPYSLQLYAPLVNFIALLLVHCLLLWFSRILFSYFHLPLSKRHFAITTLNFLLLAFSLSLFMIQIASHDSRYFLLSHLWLVTLWQLVSRIRIGTTNSLQGLLTTISYFLLLIVLLQVISNVHFQYTYLICTFACIISTSILFHSNRTSTNQQPLVNQSRNIYFNQFIEVMVWVSVIYIFIHPMTSLLVLLHSGSRYENSMALSAMMLLSVLVILFESGNRLKKLNKTVRESFDSFWEIDHNSRTLLKIRFNKRLLLLASGLVVSFLIMNIGMQVYAKNLDLAWTYQKQNSKLLVPAIPIPTEQSTKPPTDTLDSESSSKPDSEWSGKIVEGLQLSKTPSSIYNNLSTLAKDKAFSSKSCKILVSDDFEFASEVTQCISRLDNAPSALFVGNSHGAMLQDSVGKVFNDLGYSEEGIFTSSCTISPKVIPILNSTPVRKCKNFGEDLARYVKRKKPDLIIISEALNVSILNASGESIQGVKARGFLINNLENTLKDFGDTTKKIILIDAFPQLPNISTCMGASGELNKCVTTSSGTSIYREINRILAEKNSLSLVSPMGWLCFQGRCPAIIGQVLVSPDGSHLTPEFGVMVTRLLKSQMSAAIKSFE